MRVNVKRMQRVLHRHTFWKLNTNGRLKCMTCPYYVPRGQTYVPKRTTPNSDSVNYNALNMRELTELARKHKLSGISKMRKPELVSALVGMMK